MKLEIMIYGRGVQQDDGYHMFVKPECWSENMLIFMDSFMDIKNGTSSDSIKEAFAHTYVFVAKKEYNCCALIRNIGVKKENGGWLTDAFNRMIWSFEGVCCQYKDRELFFAMLPTLIMWFENLNSSLYEKINRNEISNIVDINDDLMYNPYSGQVINNQVFENFDENTKASFLDLNAAIYCSKNVFNFAFGTLADKVMNEVGKAYGLSSVFPTDRNYIGNEYFDYMKEITKASVIQRRNKGEEYILNYHLQYDKGEGWKRYWGLYPVNKNSKEESIKSEGNVINIEKGIDISILQAESEEAILFAKAIGMEQYDPNDNIAKKYRFRKGE